MMAKARGLSLVGVIWFAAFFLAVHLGVISIVEGARHRVALQKFEQAAFSMAQSGADYAQAMTELGEWNSPRTYSSPELDGGRFRVDLSRAGQGWKIVCVGQSGPRTSTVRRVLP